MICSVSGCNDLIHAKNLCGKHYQRLRLKGSVFSRSREEFEASKPCMVDICLLNAVCRGYCEKHYRRFVRTGSPLLGGRFTADADAAFERLVIRDPDPNECWGWRGKVGYAPNGSPLFGTVSHGLGASERAHRFSYRKYKGEIPDEMHVLHSCDFEPCTNPAHLYLGTQTINMDDMFSKHRHKGPTQLDWQILLTPKQQEYLQYLGTYNPQELYVP